ncbi:MAG: metallophosphoesterase [Bacteroidia bacterium]|nr:metallophosphoesterase [Bacteroidia bacterium]
MRWGFLIAVWLIAEIGGYYGLKRLGLWKPWMGWISPTMLGLMLSLFTFGRWVSLSVEAYKQIQLLGGGVFLIWLATILSKLLGGIWGILSTLKPKDPQETFSEGRRATLQVIGGVFMSLPAIALGYGYWIGRYRFRLHEVEVDLSDLPPAWDGVTILHFSDLHSGSFLSSKVLSPVWEHIEALEPDMIVFTGDWVNTFAEELRPFVSDLARLQAPLGKWAVMGNHDYGDYIAGASQQRRQRERVYLQELVRRTGFTILDNTAITLERAGQTLAIVGVGNWSHWRRFQRYGNLAQAWAQVPKDTCAILLSHDPTHWEYEVQGRYPIALTLSGHTHGLQVGVEWMSYRFSPAQWLYTYWAGLYQMGQQYLYVNRGLGYIGFPARLGIWPEITLLRLRSKQIHSK